MDPQYRVERFGMCVRGGNVHQVAALLRSSPELASAGLKGPHGATTPLHLAAERGHFAVARTLLRCGADVHARDEGDNATPLHWAAEGGHLAVCRLLLQAGADPNATDDLHERGPLGWAVGLHGYQPEAARLLLREGARCDLFAAIGLGDPQLLDQALSSTPDAAHSRMSRFEGGRTPIHFAIQRDRLELLPQLIAAGADVNRVSESGETPLLLAAMSGRAEAVEQLKRLGALTDLPSAVALDDPDEFDLALRHAPRSQVDAALCVAAAMGRDAMLEAALGAGADPNARGAADWLRGAPALVLAANGNHTSCVRRLLNCGARADAVSEYPVASALHFAAWNGNLEAIRALLDTGCPLHLEDGMFGADAFGWAAENSQEETISLLIDRGDRMDPARAAHAGRMDLLIKMLDHEPESLNRVFGWGAALHQAALHGRLEMVRLLLERGADTGIWNRDGDTALEVVRRARAGTLRPSNLPTHPEIEGLLREARYRRARRGSW